MPQQRLQFELAPTPPAVRHEMDATTANAAVASQTIAPRVLEPGVVGNGKAAKRQKTLHRALKVAKSLALQFALLYAPFVALGLLAFVGDMFLAIWAGIGALFVSGVVFFLWGATEAERNRCRRDGMYRRRRWLVRRRRATQQALVVAALHAALWSALMMNWPAQSAFAFSQSALERLAARVERGEAVAFPVQIGAFRIYGVGTDPDEKGAYLYYTEPDEQTALIHDHTPHTKPPLSMNVGAPLAPRWSLYWND